MRSSNKQPSLFGFSVVNIVYNAALLFMAIAGAPWWLFRLATTQKYRDGLWARLGRVAPLKGAEGRPLVWVHAVSVGEVLAVSRLVTTLEAELPQYSVAVSTTTRTGQELARERFGRDRVFYCPLDLPWAVRAYLNRLQPAMLVLAETEFWPNLLHGCFRRGIPVVVVNARISDRSWPRYWQLRGLWRGFLSRLTAVLAQSELDAERLRALGCGTATVAGNLKFDVRSDRDAWILKLLAESLVQPEGRLRLMVAGSTVEGEEAALLSAWPQVLRACPNLTLVIAPRHPERFNPVVDLLRTSGYPWRRRSGFPWRRGDECDPSPPPLQPGEILLLDSIGELAAVYSLADLAFVGGSLVPAGGHNPLEPSQFGVPVAMGGYFENFRAIVEGMLARDALKRVATAGLAEALAAMLNDPEGSAAMGERGRQVFQEQAGATARSVAAIAAVLAQRAGV